jgi:cold shock CspA family protein
MAGSHQSFNKKEREKKKEQKRKEKEMRKKERKANSKGGAFEDMIAYVDQYGNLTDTPPDPSKREKIEAESIETSIPKSEKKDRNFEKQGTVAFFNHDKGYGFINDSDSGDKFFVHVNGLLEPIKEGDQVIYELEKGLKGMNAVRVKKV